MTNGKTVIKPEEENLIDLLGVKSLEELAEEVKHKENVQEKEYADTAAKQIFKKVLASAKRKKNEIVILICYFLVIANMVFVILQNMAEFAYLSTTVHTWMHPILVTFEIILPFGVWIASTAYDAYNYHAIKKNTFIVCLANWVLLMWSYFRVAVSQGMKVLLFSIPTSGIVEPHVIVLATYVAAASVSVLPFVGIVYRIHKSMKDPLMQQAIIRFHVKKVIPVLPWTRRFNYDLNILRNLVSGKKYTIYEDDRRLHFKGVGSTGSGKSATLLTVGFEGDLQQKAKNIDYQKKQVVKMLEKGEAVLNRYFDDIDFDLEYISPAPGKRYAKIEKELEKLKYKVKIMGHTIMCPNEAFCDEMYALAKAKELKINRIDPCVNPDGSLKEDSIGFSPIYTPIITGETTESYFFRVFTAARLYSDTNQAIFELSGKGDPYFTGLNRNISVAGAVAVIIGYPLLYPGEYATIEQVQEVVNDFTAIKKYRDAIIEKYGIINDRGQITKELGKAKVRAELQFIIDRIDRDFLGPNAVKINEQATGLRNIIDESLMNPRIRKILCAKKTVDLDRALEKGELTLVNFEISLGSDSTGFGMFFMISFIQAVLRRPGTLKTRLPHVFGIDEAPMLFHPRIELCTTLFRQYNTSMMLFMQSLTQYEKNDMTRYLKNVLTGNCGHQIIFGRASLEEMRFYSELAGLTSEITEKEQVRESALSDENTSMQFSHSSDLEERNTISSDDVRYREFIECTVLSVKDSTPVPPFLGKTHFLPRDYDASMRRYHVDWSKYYKELPCEEEPVRLFDTMVSAKTDIVTHEDAPLFTSGKKTKTGEKDVTSGNTTIELTVMDSYRQGLSEEKRDVVSTVEVHDKLKDVKYVGYQEPDRNQEQEMEDEGELF